ncbi:MAG: TIGR02530 family flagellar biosynthesis protein [Armatimonadota bacterium]
MVNRLNLTIPVGNSTVNRTEATTAGKQGSFAEHLAHETERQESLKISSHAQKRLDSSQVKLTETDIKRLDEAVTRAEEKGSNQSLIMMDDLAFVVSVKNKVVITAVDEARRKEGVFTNIDSVVIA